MRGSEVAIGASNLLLGTAVGAGIGQAVFVMPKWFAAPPESLAQLRDARPMMRFWIPLQAGCAVALGTAVALNRRQRRRRRLLTLAAGLYVATWVVSGAWFAPEIVRLAKPDNGLSPSEITRRGKRWLNLSWARQAALAGAWVLTAAALGRGRSGRVALALG